uniref:Pre-mRNA-splicing factor SLU7 n=1 Tax=Pristionchus pacificus TaxID=54126 RepID=A0A8R1UW23_PRIPA
MSGFKQQTPVSQLIRTGKGGGGVDERKTRDSFRREKVKEGDLEEDRKLGIEPACVDVDSGRDINPHIPQFITQTPWYVPAEGPTLKHQRPHWERQQEVDSGVHDWYSRGVKETSSKPVKFKPGSCDNCGATTHKRKDCFERPRKLGAKHTNDDIAADDYVQPKIRLTNWEAKRDRWNGYDNAAYSEVIKEHEKQEEVRKIIKDQKLKEEKAAAEAAKEKAENSADEGTDEKMGEDKGEGDEDDEDKYAEDADMQTSVDMDSRTRITVRNLRIREDTAKYLYNLNENAPYYDPKSRSMRENPLAGVKGKEQQAAKFSGENFVRYSGEVVAANEAQVFAWSARCQGIDVHALAEPTKLEQLQKDFKSEKKDVKEETKQKLLEKYGGDEHLQAPPKELLLAQSEAYVEYSRKGAIIKGEERPLIKSRFEEDVYPKNHTAIFGSYWANGRWGFRCCHSFVKQSYCIGEQGYAVNDEMAALPTVTKKETKEEAKEVKEEEVTKEEKKDSSSSSSSSSDSSSEDSEGEREQQKKKREEEAEEEKRRSEREARKRDRKREKRKRRAEKMGGKRKRKRHNSNESSDSADSSVSEKEEDNTEDAKLQREVAKALKEEKRARKEAKKNERDRKYNTTYEFKKPTELEVEAYKLTQVHAADPMAKFMEEKRNK